MCTSCISVTGGSYWPVCGRLWSVNKTHTPAPHCTCIINKLTTACDAKQQHAVAVLTSPASGHCNDSFFFLLPANVIDTHAEETGRGCCCCCCCTASAEHGPPTTGGESCSAAHTCSQSEWMPLQGCFFSRP